MNKAINIMAVLFLLLFSAGTAEAAQWKLEKTALKPGTIDTLRLQVEGNGDPICAIQVDVKLPEGVQLIGQGQLSELANGHTLTWTALENDVYRCLIYDKAQNAEMKALNGTVLEILALIPDNFTEGNFQASGILVDKKAGKQMLPELTQPLTAATEKSLQELIVNVYNLEQSVEEDNSTVVEIEYDVSPSTIKLDVNYYKDYECKVVATEEDRKKEGVFYVKLSFPGDDTYAFFERVYQMSITYKLEISEITLPDASILVKGQLLNMSILSGGNAIYKESDANGENEKVYPVPGNFAWTDGNQVVSTAGDLEYSVTFYPENAFLYAQKGTKVKVKVLETYKIAAFVSGIGGAIKQNVQTEDSLYTEGQQIQLEAVPFPNYKFTGWLGSEGLTNPLTVTASKNTTYVAQFEPIEHSVKLVSSGSGSLTVVTTDGTLVSDGSSFQQGTNLQVSAIPADGYKLASLQANGEAMPGDKWNLQADVTFSATFEKIPADNYKITVESCDNGSVLLYTAEGTPIASGSSLEKDSKFTVATLADAGYELSGSPTITGATFADNVYTVTGEVTASATFVKKKYKVTAAALYSNNQSAEGCSITLSTTEDQEYGAVVTIADIQGDWMMILANGKEVGRYDQLTVTGNLTVIAVFRQKVDILKEYIMWPYQRTYYNGVSRNFVPFATQTYAGFSFTPFYQRVKDGDGKTVSDQELGEGIAPEDAGTYNVRLYRKADDLYKEFNGKYEGGLVIDKAAVLVMKSADNIDNIETRPSDVDKKEDTEITSGNWIRYILSPEQDDDKNNYNPIAYYLEKENAPKVKLHKGEKHGLLRAAEDEAVEGYVRVSNGGLPYEEEEDGTIEIPQGIEVTLEAVAAPGYKFANWSDNNTENPRTYTVSEDVSIYPIFEKKPGRSISLSNMESDYNGDAQTIALSGNIPNDETSAYQVSFYTDEDCTHPAVLKNAGTYYVKVYFPEDDDYAETTTKLLYTINAKVLTESDVNMPTASDVLVGKKLVESELLGGDAGIVPGTFAWEKGDTELTTAGTSAYNVTFTPNDPNYEPFTTTVSVNVVGTKAGEDEGGDDGNEGGDDGNEEGGNGGTTDPSNPSNPSNPSDPSDPDDPDEPSNPSKPDKPTGIEGVNAQLSVYTQRQAIVVETSQPAVISIVNMTGAVMFQNKITGKVFIPVGYSGLYIVKIQSQETSLVKKVSVR